MRATIWARFKIKAAQTWGPWLQKAPGSCRSCPPISTSLDVALLTKQEEAFPTNQEEAFFFFSLLAYWTRVGPWAITFSKYTGPPLCWGGPPNSSLLALCLPSAPAVAPRKLCLYLWLFSPPLFLSFLWLLLGPTPSWFLVLSSLTFRNTYCWWRSKKLFWNPFGFATIQQTSSKLAYVQLRATETQITQWLKHTEYLEVCSLELI